MMQTAVSRLARRTYATAASNAVRIVEVGPRDGLQNESKLLSAAVKVDLIRRLARTGLRRLEVGSFVSPKAIPQMASTVDVLRSLHARPLPGVETAVLVPNAKGLETFFRTFDEAPADVVSIFAAASEGFSRANTNCSVAESLERLARVAEGARAKDLRLRGYVSVVVEVRSHLCASRDCPSRPPQCPYDGRTDPKQVASVAKALLDMGCYEVSLGDTIGVASPAPIETMLNAVTAVVPVDQIAVSLRSQVPRFADHAQAHCHDTYNTGLANVLRMVQVCCRPMRSIASSSPTDGRPHCGLVHSRTRWLQLLSGRTG
jgi:hydroxymethylglutaryl-CoA lyase